MPTGRVKVFHEDRNFGFITTENGKDVFVAGQDVGDDGLASGDEVEFELDEEEGSDGPRAVSISVTKKAAADNPVGRTMSPPPSWDELEELDRQRRMARRRRR